MLVERSLEMVLGNGIGLGWAPVIAAMIEMQACVWVPHGTAFRLPVIRPPDRLTIPLASAHTRQSYNRLSLKSLRWILKFARGPPVVVDRRL